MPKNIIWPISTILFVTCIQLRICFCLFYLLWYSIILRVLLFSLSFSFSIFVIEWHRTKVINFILWTKPWIPYLFLFEKNDYLFLEVDLIDGKHQQENACHVSISTTQRLNGFMSSKVHNNNKHIKMLSRTGYVTCQIITYY